MALLFSIAFTTSEARNLPPFRALSPVRSDGAVFRLPQPVHCLSPGRRGKQNNTPEKSRGPLPD